MKRIVTAIPYVESLWRYRQFIVSAIRNDFRARFARSRLAGLWGVINPLIQVAIFATILSSVLATKLPGVENSYGYAIYLLAGMAAWGLFSETLTRCISVFVENGPILKKIVFPRICLPAIVTGVSLFHFLIFMCAVLVVVFVTHRWPGWAIVHLVPLSALLVAFAISLGLFLGTLNVFMRDVAPVMQVVVQLWFWFTPVVYPITVVPESVRVFLSMNPIYPAVDGFHRVLLYSRPPVWSDLIPLTILTIILAISALVAFRKASPDMVDAL